MERARYVFTLWCIAMGLIWQIWGFSGVGSFIGFGLLCFLVSSILVDTMLKAEKNKAIENELESRSNGYMSFEEGQHLYQEREWRNAVDCFDKAIANGYESGVYASRADCLHQLGLHESAIIDYGKAIAQEPEDCNLYFMRSNARKAQGDPDGAIQDLEKAVELSQIESELNKTYREGAKQMGWPGGHTELYLTYLTGACRGPRPFPT